MNRKPNLLLVLDQTLISAEEPHDIRDMKHEKKKHFKMYNMDDEFHIFCRPKLQEFLDYAFKNFNVSIWTAASKDYALFIIEKIITRPHRKPDFIFFSYHCDISKKEKKYAKNLKMLWDVYKLDGYTKDNTFILDDYIEEVHQCQPNNCIIAPPFEVTKKNSENDDFFEKLIPELEKLKKRIENKDANLCSSINNSIYYRIE